MAATGRREWRRWVPIRAVCSCSSWERGKIAGSTTTAAAAEMATTQASPPHSDSRAAADLQPTPKQQQTLFGLEMAATWVSLVVNIPNYYLASSLFNLGMTWWQGIATVGAANSVISFCLVLAGHPGARYDIPFPVLAHSAFGVHGAHIVTLIRSLIGCGWFSVESWIGGQAIFLLLPASLCHLDALSRSIP